MRYAINIKWDMKDESGSEDYEFPVDLPYAVCIPDDVENDEIGDYLSDLTSFCHDGFLFAAKSLPEICYDFYKTDWLLNHQTQISRRECLTSKALFFMDSENYDEFGTEWQTYLEKEGFGSCCFVCYEEFLQNEFLDKEYIDHLLSDIIDPLIAGALIKWYRVWLDGLVSNSAANSQE